MQNKTFKKVLLLLVVMVILPPPFKLIDNQLNAQNDAFFYTMSPDDRDGSVFTSDFYFEGFPAPYTDDFSFGDFDPIEQNSPLGDGLFLLAGGALAWVLAKERRKRT